MTIEQKYYETLTRTDHPVFNKDFSVTTDKSSPLNSIFNRIFAKQLIKLKLAVDSVSTNSFPHLVDETSIDAWEAEYFGYIKAGQLLSDRVDQLLIKFNNSLKMNVASVVYLAQSITGKTPIVFRSLAQDGWVLDQSALDVDTIFIGSTSAADASTYLVIFDTAVSSELLDLLDSELTKIEKGGSKHFIFAQPDLWVLDANSLDVNTNLG
jgi:hypothetical protein